jgi:T5orf172 domain
MKAKKVTEQDLTDVELAFIKRHCISVEEIIDVRGMIPIGQKRAMEVHGARLGISHRSCTKNHRFKTRSNHCPICEPKNLAFERRHSETAFVYACKSETGLIKIGYAKDTQDRKSRLNREAFASCSAWRLIFSLHTEHAGKVEALAHGYLSSSRSAETYGKGDQTITSREVFVCSEQDAVAAIKRAASYLTSRVRV